MDDPFNPLRERIERLEAAVGEVRDHLHDCVQVINSPRAAMTLARNVAESLTKMVLEKLHRKPPGTLDACLAELETPQTMSLGLVPGEIISLLHMIRVMGNKATHDVLRIQPTSADVDLVLRSLLRVVEWYFAEFRRGPQLDPLFSTTPPRLQVDAPPPEVRMPPLLISGPVSEGLAHKVFIFTERLLGLGREKTSRDPRVHIVARLLPCPDPGHPNFNLNLENISRFHAQLRWELGRAEIRDEDSDKGVFLNDRRIALGTWTLCSFPDPAHVKLGPEGFEFTLSEIIRQVDGSQVHCLRLLRLNNWPYHEYLVVSRPLITVGADSACVVCRPEVDDLVATIASSEHGWAARTADGHELAIEPGALCPLGTSGLSVKRATEADFLS